MKYTIVTCLILAASINAANAQVWGPGPPQPPSLPGYTPAPGGYDTPYAPWNQPWNNGGYTYTQPQNNYMPPYQLPRVPCIPSDPINHPGRC